MYLLNLDLPCKTCEADMQQPTHTHTLTHTHTHTHTLTHIHTLTQAKCGVCCRLNAFRCLNIYCCLRRNTLPKSKLNHLSSDIISRVCVCVFTGTNASAFDQLVLTLAWDRVDIAKDHVFVYGQQLLVCICVCLCADKHRETVVFVVNTHIHCDLLTSQHILIH